MAETHYKQELYPLSVVIATLGGETLADTISYLNSGEKIPAEILVCIPEEDSSCAESLSMKNVKIIKQVPLLFRPSNCLASRLPNHRSSNGTIPRKKNNHTRHPGTQNPTPAPFPTGPVLNR